MRRRSRALLIGGSYAALCLVVASLAQGQPAGTLENPVFVNDSPAAAEAMLRVGDNIASGNLDQAVRLLQKLLDDDAQALVARPEDASLFVPVRQRVHETLLANPELLAKYRRAQSAQAELLLTQQQFEALERARLLTPSGLRAALCIASDHIEAARFNAALLVLRELDAHPDRREAGPGAEAARVAALLARYTTGADAQDMARRWTIDAHLSGAPVEVVAGPPHLAAVSPLVPQSTPKWEGIVAKPLASVPFGPREAIDPLHVPKDVHSNDQLPSFARELRVMPTVVGETIYLVSPKFLGAFDRVTLTPRWRKEITDLVGVEADVTEADADRSHRAIADHWEDIASVATAGQMVVATATHATDTRGDEQETVVAVDSRTGKVRWSIRPNELDPQLARSRVRGPLRVEGDVVVLTMRKDLRDRRLAAVYLVGLDLADGSLRWLNLMGSIGSLPFSRQSEVTDAGVLDRGVYYRIDRIGLLGAYEGASGRPVWVRRLASAPSDNPSPSSPWQISMPVVHGQRVTVLSPDRTQIVTYDRDTGVEVSRFPSDRLGKPAYLLGIDNRLIGVSESRVTFTSLDDPAQGPFTATRPFESPGILGRVVAAGKLLVVPLASGIAMIDPAEPGRPAQFTPLDEPGNVIFDSEQLLIADDSAVHSYLSWESADRMLSARLVADPADAKSAVDLADMAYSGGHPKRLVFAIDAAMKALAANPANPDAPAVRNRLLASLRVMIDSSQADPVPPGRLARSAPAEPKPLDDVVLGEVIERAGRLASTPSDRVAHLLSLALHQRRLGADTDAAATYQEILASPELASAQWQGRQVSQRAEIEATRRLERLLVERGRACYAAFDRQARSAFGAISASTSVEDLEELARRYPVALVTPELWGKIATAYETQNRPRAGARALEVGFQSALRLGDIPPAITGELAGRLVVNLRDRGLLVGAWEMLRYMRDKAPAVVLTINGKPLDGAAMSAQLGAQVALERRWPRVGMPRREGLQTLLGWGLMEPLCRTTRPNAPSIAVLRHQDGRVGIYGSNDPARPEGESSMLWTMPASEDPLELVRLDRRSAYFYIAQANGPVLERVDAGDKTATVSWRSQPFSTYFEMPAGSAPQPVGAPEAAAPDRFTIPLMGLRSAAEIVLCTDDRTFVLIERGGRAVAFDADSGAALWSVRLGLSRVHHADVAGNLLAIVGEREVRGSSPSAPASGLEPLVLLVEARTGRVMHQVRSEWDAPNWLRLTSRGDPIIGFEKGVVAIDPETGSTTWVNIQDPCHGSLRAWANGQNLLVVAADRALWSINLVSGALRGSPVDAHGRLDNTADAIAYQVDADRLALCSAQGLAILSSTDGALIGADALGAGDNVLPPVPAEGSFLVVETSSAARQAPAAQPGNVFAAGVYSLHALESRTGMIVSTAALSLGDTPQRMAIMDGRILLTAGHTTIVYSAPAENAAH